MPAMVSSPSLRVLSLIVLAAGLGSRFKGTKQIAGVGPQGETLLEIGLQDAFAAGFRKFVLVVSAAVPEEFRARIKDHWAGLAEVVYVEQRKDDLPVAGVDFEARVKPWGTGHALYAARGLASEDFAVMNADDYYGPDSFRALAGFLREGSGFGLVGFRLADTLSEHGAVSRGICSVDEAGSVKSITETRGIRRGPHGLGAYAADDSLPLPLREDDWASMNLFALRESLWPEVETALGRFLKDKANHAAAEFELPRTVLGAAGNLGCPIRLLPTSEKWMGVTFPEDRAAVEAFLRKRESL
jgi:NDP-sugar pyrophosphorylase family protein